MNTRSGMAPVARPVYWRLATWRRQAIAAFADLDDRLTPIEGRLLLVDTLPDEAPLGALIRLRNDPTGALYTGNGNGRPLGKLTPTPV